MVVKIEIKAKTKPFHLPLPLILREASRIGDDTVIFAFHDISTTSHRNVELSSFLRVSSGSKRARGAESGAWETDMRVLLLIFVCHALYAAGEA